MADVFTLEALNAKYGDSLLLHYGDAADPRLIVIDGGPATVYGDALRPRLDAIQQARGGGQLEIRMLMVSHIDLDHINGVLKLTEALRKDQDAKRPLPFDILTLWHNSFDDLVGSAGATALSPVSQSVKMHTGQARASSLRSSEPDLPALPSVMPL